MRRELYASQAELVIVTAQDVLELGGEAKMNTPATTQGNWTWRMTQAQLDDAAWERLGEEARAAQRAGRPTCARPRPTPSCTAKTTQLTLGRRRDDTAVE